MAKNIHELGNFEGDPRSEAGMDAIKLLEAQAEIDYGSQTTAHDAKIAEAFQEAHEKAGTHPEAYVGITPDGREITLRVELAHDENGNLVASPNVADVREISESTQGKRKSIHNQKYGK